VDPRLLVLGGDGGVGRAVVTACNADGWNGLSADVRPSSPDTFNLDVTNAAQVAKFFREQDPFDSVVYAAGRNGEAGISNINFTRTAKDIMDVNYHGVVAALQAWARTTVKNPGLSPKHFVVVSSNSAHVARSRSSAYCASKAAVSMLVRCVARELAFNTFTIWAVEPGFIEDTPMSTELIRRLEGVPAHRIPGERTLTAASLAAYIMKGINGDFTWLNGTTLRIDGGEQ